jgi:hypothetical protein
MGSLGLTSDQVKINFPVGKHEYGSSLKKCALSSSSNASDVKAKETKKCFHRDVDVDDDDLVEFCPL